MLSKAARLIKTKACVLKSALQCQVASTFSPEGNVVSGSGEENDYENVPKRPLEVTKTISKTSSNESKGVGKRSQNGKGPRPSIQQRRNRSKRQPLKEEDAQTLTPKSSLR